MKIQVMSDLHLEFGSMEISNDQNADVLVLAGDILLADALRRNHVRSDDFRRFLKSVCSQFHSVVFVAGNHEFYGSGWTKTLKILQEEATEYVNLYFLEDDTLTIGDTVFIGSTLWTDYNKGDKQGAPFIDEDDVPVELRVPEHEQCNLEFGETDSNWFARWDYVLGEMIWAFAALEADDEYTRFYSKEDGFDLDGIKAYNDRIDNGCRLFGKYFRNLWR